MTEKLKETINIPIWLVVLILPLLFSILVVTTSTATNQAEDNAVFRTSIGVINERLNRIENKLDNHINK
jgi:hypothetical protein